MCAPQYEWAVIADSEDPNATLARLLHQLATLRRLQDHILMLEKVDSFIGSLPRKILHGMFAILAILLAILLIYCGAAYEILDHQTVTFLLNSLLLIEIYLVFYSFYMIFKYYRGMSYIWKVYEEVEQFIGQM